MKSIVVAALLAIASVTYAGGEIAGVPAVPPPPAYYPLPIYRTQSVEVDKPGFVATVRNYFVDRGNDTLDIIAPVVDLVVGIATFDPELDDIRAK